MGAMAKVSAKTLTQAPSAIFVTADLTEALIAAEKSMSSESNTLNTLLFSGLFAFISVILNNLSVVNFLIIYDRSCGDNVTKTCFHP